MSTVTELATALANAAEAEERAITDETHARGIWQRAVNAAMIATDARVKAEQALIEAAKA